MFEPSFLRECSPHPPPSGPPRPTIITTEHHSWDKTEKPTITPSINATEIRRTEIYYRSLYRECQSTRMEYTQAKFTTRGEKNSGPETIPGEADEYFASS